MIEGRNLFDPGSAMKKTRIRDKHPGSTDNVQSSSSKMIFAGAARRGAGGAGRNPRRLHPRRPGEGQDQVHRENLQVRHQCFR